MKRITASTFLTFNNEFNLLVIILYTSSRACKIQCFSGNVTFVGNIIYQWIFLFEISELTAHQHFPGDPMRRDPMRRDPKRRDPMQRDPKRWDPKRRDQSAETQCAETQCDETLSNDIQCDETQTARPNATKYELFFWLPVLWAIDVKRRKIL